MEDRFKIRVWLVKEKIMTYPEFFKIDYEDETVSIYGYDGKLKINIEAIPMLCTGLKDMKGKLIYEGDIVTVTESIDKVFLPFETAIIKYIDGGYQLEPTSEESQLIGYYRLIGKWKNYFFVRGNIYENPELLEVK